ncbi:hypothetical protein ABZ883_14835 [Streptomyces sp. NPDC046977]|uniref:hypothetical protein n=1 Tax=Streptomyces sp. NPDC046977 TaxID=3154703 RepID=UPI0033EDDFF0
MYQPPQPQRQVIEQGANHTLHIILSIFTCGLWLPIWAIAAAMGRKKTITSYGPPVQQSYPSQYPPQGQYGPPPGQLPPGQTPPPGYGYPPPQPQQNWQQPPPGA